MKTKEEIMKGCEHDGSFIPVDEVKRLMQEYADQVKFKMPTDQEIVQKLSENSVKNKIIDRETYVKGFISGINFIKEYQNK